MLATFRRQEAQPLPVHCPQPGQDVRQRPAGHEDRLCNLAGPPIRLSLLPHPQGRAWVGIPAAAHYVTVGGAPPGGNCFFLFRHLPMENPGPDPGPRWTRGFVMSLWEVLLLMAEAVSQEGKLSQSQSQVRALPCNPSSLKADAAGRLSGVQGQPGPESEPSPHPTLVPKQQQIY